MCLLFLSYRVTPGYKLVLAANRDEFLARETAPLNFIDDEKTILCGIDLQGGGTWLGIDSKMRFGALTNFRDPQADKPEAPSRGDLILNYLRGGTTSREYIELVSAEGGLYNGFNLVVGDRRELFYFSNRQRQPRRLSPGFYGLSNSFLDTEWPKVSRGKQLLSPHMVDTAKIVSEDIFSMLADTHHPPDASLPDTGVGLDWERMLSPIYIDSPAYGTRSSAIVTIDDENRIQFYEKTYLRKTQSDTNQIVYKAIESERPIT